MKEREGIVVTGVLTVLLLAWLGFLVHRSPRFPGSGVGAGFGIAGAVLMLVPLAYPIAKRSPFLHARITAHVSMQSLLTLHASAGIFGPLLAVILHGALSAPAIVASGAVEDFASGYQHPSSRSKECVQCHQPPPSHFMEHFSMISQKIAGKEHASVDQCFECHNTTGWNDIVDVGFYKHH